MEVNFGYKLYGSIRRFNVRNLCTWIMKFHNESYSLVAYHSGSSELKVTRISDNYVTKFWVIWHLLLFCMNLRRLSFPVSTSSELSLCVWEGEAEKSVHYFPVSRIKWIFLAFSKGKEEDVEEASEQMTVTVTYTAPEVRNRCSVVEAIACSNS
jgi:hypothetical protein